MSRTTGALPGSAEIADRLAIAEVLAAHSRGLDRLDAGLIHDCYWPEAEVDYGSYKGPAHAFADLVVEALAAQYELTRHGLTNTLYQFAGDTARTESCVTAAHLARDAGSELLFYGRYLDRLERRDGCWKILHRQVVVDWGRTVAVDDLRSQAAFADLARGAHREADPLHTFLAVD